MWVLSIPPPSASRSGAPYVAEAAHLPLQLDGPAVWQHSGTKPVPKSRVSGSRHIPIPLADGTHACVQSRTRRPAVDERIRVVRYPVPSGAARRERDAAAAFLRFLTSEAIRSSKAPCVRPIWSG